MGKGAPRGGVSGIERMGARPGGRVPFFFTANEGRHEMAEAFAMAELEKLWGAWVESLRNGKEKGE